MLQHTQLNSTTKYQRHTRDRLGVQKPVTQSKVWVEVWCSCGCSLREREKGAHQHSTRQQYYRACIPDSSKHGGQTGCTKKQLRPHSMQSYVHQELDTTAIRYTYTCWLVVFRTCSTVCFRRLISMQFLAPPREYEKAVVDIDGHEQTGVHRCRRSTSDHSDMTRNNQAAL